MGHRRRVVRRCHGRVCWLLRSNASLEFVRDPEIAQGHSSEAWECARRLSGFRWSPHRPEGRPAARDPQFAEVDEPQSLVQRGTAPGTGFEVRGQPPAVATVQRGAQQCRPQATTLKGRGHAQGANVVVRLLKVVRSKNTCVRLARGSRMPNTRTRPSAPDNGIVIFHPPGGNSTLAPRKSSVVSTRPAGNT